MAFRMSGSPGTAGIEREHRHLRSMLQTVHEELACGDAARYRVAELLGELAGEIHGHFLREERSGYYADVLDAAPRLKNQIDRLHVQHAGLLDCLEQLKSAAAGVNAENGWTEFVEAFHDFTFRFLEHEVDENSLLHEAYHRDIGAED